VALLRNLRSYILTSFYPPSDAVIKTAASTGITPIGHYVATRITVDGDLPVNSNTTFTAYVYDSLYSIIPEDCKV
jgi:hypothetical protein